MGLGVQAHNFAVLGQNQKFGEYTTLVNISAKSPTLVNAWAGYGIDYRVSECMVGKPKLLVVDSFQTLNREEMSIQIRLTGQLENALSATGEGCSLRQGAHEMASLVNERTAHGRVRSIVCRSFGYVVSEQRLQSWRTPKSQPSLCCLDRARRFALSSNGSRGAGSPHTWMLAEPSSALGKMNFPSEAVCRTFEHSTFSHAEPRYEQSLAIRLSSDRSKPPKTLPLFLDHLARSECKAGALQTLESHCTQL